MTSLRITSVIIFLSLCLTSSIKAQQNKFDIGVEGGPGVSQFRGDYSLSFQPILAGAAGVTFQYNFPKIISIRTCLDYERLGWKDYYTGWFPLPPTYGSVSTMNRFDYLTFPILAQASFGKKIRVFFNAGAHISYDLRSGYFQNFDISGMSSTRYLDMTDYYKQFDFGISFGAGIEVPIKKQLAFTFEARNNIGLLNISNGREYAGLPYNGETYTCVFLAGFKYKLGMRSKS